MSSVIATASLVLHAPTLISSLTNEKNVHLHSLIHIDKNTNHTQNHNCKTLFLFEQTKKNKTNIEGLELITAYRKIKN